MRRTTKPPLHAATAAQLSNLVEDARYCLPPDKARAILGKWLDGLDPPQTMTEFRQLSLMADAVLLSADLLLSQPSATGATAFDRLARKITAPSAGEAAALQALRRARFRLLRLDGAGCGDDVAVRDVVSAETLRLRGAELPPVPDGTVLFGRVAMMGDAGYLAGSLTPLDEAATTVAARHAPVGAAGGTAAARWAETVYGHVVRHGTLDVVGLNRPREGFDLDAKLESSDAVHLIELWAELDGAAPSAELLKRTRQAADLEGIMEAMCIAEAAGQSSLAAMRSACERALLVLLETVLAREHAASGGLTLDLVGQAVDAAVRDRRLPKTAARLFASLRAQLGGGAEAGKADPALGRLMQVIQALRAKTVAQGCTEHEALAAAEKVAELLDRHGLSLGEIDFRAQACTGAAVQTTRKRAAPVDNCLPAIAAFFDCRVWSERDTSGAFRYVFFGLHADVAAAQYLHELVERTFVTETDTFRAGKIYQASAGERRAATTSFQVGLARGISRKLEKMQASRASHRRSASGRDLVVVKAAMVDEELAKLGLDLQSKGGPKGRRVLTDAFDAGHRAGERFEWAQLVDKAA